MPQHKEAFALMWYTCDGRTTPTEQTLEGCGHRERIWNSRDGVTPFGTSCPSCNGSLLHSNWNLDRPDQNYKLKRWQKFWRDGTMEEALDILNRRFELWKTRGHTIPEEQQIQMLAAVREDTSPEFPKGWPMLDIHKP